VTARLPARKSWPTSHRRSASSNDSNPSSLTDVNGTLYFSADDGLHGAEAVEIRRHCGRHLTCIRHRPRYHWHPIQLRSSIGTVRCTSSQVTSISAPSCARPVTLSAVTTLAPLSPEPGPTEPDFLSNAVLLSARSAVQGPTVLWRERWHLGFRALVDGWNRRRHRTGLQISTTARCQSSPCGLTVFNGRLYFRASPRLRRVGFPALVDRRHRRPARARHCQVHRLRSSMVLRSSSFSTIGCISSHPMPTPRAASIPPTAPQPPRSSVKAAILRVSCRADPDRRLERSPGAAERRVREHEWLPGNLGE